MPKGERCEATSGSGAGAPQRVRHCQPQLQASKKVKRAHHGQVALSYLAWHQEPVKLLQAKHSLLREAGSLPSGCASGKQRRLLRRGVSVESIKQGREGAGLGGLAVRNCRAHRHDCEGLRALCGAHGHGWWRHWGLCFRFSPRRSDRFRPRLSEGRLRQGPSTLRLREASGFRELTWGWLQATGLGFLLVSM